MAEVGIKTVYLHYLGKTIELDHSYLGVQKADIKGLQGALTNISGNNVVQYSYQEPAKPTAQITVNQAGMQLIADLTGMKKSTVSGLFTQSGRLPRVGVVVVSEGLAVDKDVVYAFPTCRAAFTTVSLSTNTDSKKNIVYDQITFNANYDEKIKGLYAGGEIEKDTAEDVLKGFGWEDVQSNTGEFKDDEDDSATTTPAASHNA